VAVLVEVAGVVGVVDLEAVLEVFLGEVALLVAVEQAEAGNYMDI
jgi:hypothetical protein